MKVRFIMRGTRCRCVVRSNDLTALCTVANDLDQVGMEEVSILTFWLHVLFWWRKKERLVTAGPAKAK